jgi:DNA-binding transcriptional LysR family regulator
MKSSMKQREMQLLWEVHRTGSVTLAAEHVAVSQPAASALLRDLEERLGFAIFQREKRRLRFTLKGAALLPDIANALAALDSLSRLTDSLRADAPQRLVIGCVASAAATLLPPALRRLRETLPGMEISVRTAMSVEIERQVSESRIDFGLVVRDPSPPGPGQLHVAALSLCCVVPAGHRLARRKALDMADIQGLPYVSLGRQFTVGSATVRLLEGAGLSYAPTVEVMHYSTACAFVRDGWGVAILDSLSRQYAPDFGLVSVPIRQSPQMALELLWSPLNSRSAMAPDLALFLSRP